jgi:hypothetical protein
MHAFLSLSSLTVPSLALLGSQDSSMLVLHLDSERFTVPGVDSPNHTSKADFIGFRMNVSSMEGSPEGVSISTFTVTTPVMESRTGLLSSCTVVLPKRGWVFYSIVLSRG